MDLKPSIKKVIISIFIAIILTILSIFICINLPKQPNKLESDKGKLICDFDSPSFSDCMSYHQNLAKLKLIGILFSIFLFFFLITYFIYSLFQKPKNKTPFFIPPLNIFHFLNLFKKLLTSTLKTNQTNSINKYFSYDQYSK